jgi:membrane-associated protein
MTEWFAQVTELPAVAVAAVLSAVMMFDAIPLIGVLVPGDAAVLIAMGTTDWLRSAGVLVGVVAGCVAGWSISFAAGRYFGDRIRRGRLGTWIGTDRWAVAEQALRTGGGRIVLVAPFLPVLNALMPLAAGGLRMSYRRFVSFAALGAVLWAGLYVAMGAVAAALSEVLPGGAVATIGTIAVGVAFGWLVLLGIRRKLGAAMEASLRAGPALSGTR